MKYSMDICYECNITRAFARLQTNVSSVMFGVVSSLSIFRIQSQVSHANLINFRITMRKNLHRNDIIDDSLVFSVIRHLRYVWCGVHALHFVASMMNYILIFIYSARHVRRRILLAKTSEKCDTSTPHTSIEPID